MFEILLLGLLQSVPTGELSVNLLTRSVPGPVRLATNRIQPLLAL
jgi:hypothetical protein